jgi:hypothetical protein
MKVLILPYVFSVPHPKKYVRAHLNEGNIYSKNMLLIKDNLKNPSNTYDVVNVSIKDTKKCTSMIFFQIAFH